MDKLLSYLSPYWHINRLNWLRFCEEEQIRGCLPSILKDLRDKELAFVASLERTHQEEGLTLKS